jgi:hypothetical protein
MNFSGDGAVAVFTGRCTLLVILGDGYLSLHLDQMNSGEPK